MSTRAMSWLTVGVVYMEAVLVLAAVEIETNAGEEASRLLGQTVLELAAVREPQLAGPYYLAAASFALWRGDVSDASRSVDRGWASVRETEEWVLVARMAAMVAQVDAAAAAEARHQRQLAPLATARQRTADVLDDRDQDRPGRRRARRPPDRGRWRRPGWPRPAPTSAGWRARTTDPPGARWPRRGRR